MRVSDSRVWRDDWQSLREFRGLKTGEDLAERVLFNNELLNLIKSYVREKKVQAITGQDNVRL